MKFLSTEKKCSKLGCADTGRSVSSHEDAQRLVV